jgi:ElaB/YqjD/DUF883 family membrane-anchored ribosome-binding protein
MPEISARKLATDCRIVMRDVEEVVRTMAGEATQSIGDFRERRRKHLENQEEGPALTEFTSELVEDAWGKVALAAGIGLIAGLCMRRVVKRLG